MLNKNQVFKKIIEEKHKTMETSRIDKILWPYAIQIMYVECLLQFHLKAPKK